MTKRITARVPDDVNEKLDIWYVKLGLTKSQLAGIAVQAGLDSVLRAISPVDSLSELQLARILRVAEAAGVGLKGVDNESSD